MATETVGDTLSSFVYWFPNVMTRVTKSQKFSAVCKVYETSTNQISCSYHEGIPSY